MTSRPFSRSLTGLFVLGAAACHHECITIPGCLAPMAASLTITSATTHAPVNGATIIVNGDTTNVVSCNGNCMIPGYAGHYHLEISAPGYQTVQQDFVAGGTTRTVNVYGPEGFEGKSCGCPETDTQQLQIELSPAA